MVKPVVKYVIPKQPEVWLSNGELAKAIETALKNLGDHFVKYNTLVKQATEAHYIALINEELRRAKANESMG